MAEIVDARDVLDANAKTRCAFRAKLLGRFERTGPNSWDPYRFEPIDDERTIDVLPRLKVQVEKHGAVFRIRSHGKVWRAEWLEGGPDARERFMATCVGRFRNLPGRGLTAVIAKKLMGKGRKRIPD